MAQLTESDIRRIIREELQAVFNPQPLPKDHPALSSFEERFQDAERRAAISRAKRANKAGGIYVSEKG